MATIVSAFFGGTQYIYKNSKLYIDYPYGTEERQTLDLSIPKGASGETGLIVFIHGGGWTMGNKKEYRNDITEWNKKGYVTAALNYRFVDEGVDGDGMMDDITSALGVIRSLAEKQGVTLNKCLLTGASAGAHLCLLYAYSRKDEAPIEPACVVEFCGPCDFTQRDYMMNELIVNVNQLCCGFEYNEENFEQGISYYNNVSPVYYIKNAVPTVIAHGKNDEIVPFTQAEILDKALIENGITHDFVTYPTAGHGLIADTESYKKTMVLFEQYAETYLK